MKLLLKNLLFTILVLRAVAVEVSLLIARGTGIFTHLALLAVGILLPDTKWILPVN